ncbi:MAG: lytic transglycosylase domain-containing protein, partial [Burkholderiaceae bacterium]
ALVAEAYDIGRKTKLDPTLILAIMAVESGFNPFAQSAVGAQGLMQVMTKIHGDKYETFGGDRAAFDPVTNVRVGVKVLQECIARAGSLEGGLKYYVGAANLDDDSGYASKVMAEHARIQSVAAGRGGPSRSAHVLPVSAPAQESAAPTKSSSIVRS